MPLTPLQKDVLAVFADEHPDLPIGVAFVDAAGKPGWIGDDPALRLHASSVRGCWPTVHGLEP